MKLWTKSGEIAAKARDFGFKLLKEDALLIEVTERIESFIEKNGGKLAFPVQLSINQIAAHYTTLPNDPKRLATGDIIKLDLGVHIQGCIADTAITREIKTENNQELIKASEEALKEAIKLATPGTELREIGKAINETITSHNFNPIKNLSGHEIKEYAIHGGISIPNFDNGDKTKLKENQIIALEPFATKGNGFVKEGKPSGIYRVITSKPVRDSSTREILDYTQKEFNGLPFSTRQLIKKFNPLKIRIALNTLEKEGILYQYPMLPESSDGIVSQAEHTIIVKDKPIITTRI